jgi:DNA-binding XRE family transcriptional regulator
MIEEAFNKLLWYKKMKVLRVGYGWTQKEAGEKLFITSKNYWQWEQGKCYPRLANRKLIATIFEMEMHHIFSSTDEILKSA